MITKETVDFLLELRNHNTKEWFDSNRKWYERVRANFITFTEELIRGIESFDEAVLQTQLEPKKTMMRINRDIRFSKDKTPYNSHFFTYINRGGKKSPTAGYFFSLDPGRVFYGAGTYKPPSDVLANIRQEIDFNREEWKSIVEDGNLKKHFGEVIFSEELSRPPRGYDKDHPLLSWIKRKDFYVKKAISDSDLIKEDLVESILKSLKEAKDLVQFQNRTTE